MGARTPSTRSGRHPVVQPALDGQDEYLQPRLLTELRSLVVHQHASARSGGKVGHGTSRSGRSVRVPGMAGRRTDAAEGWLPDDSWEAMAEFDDGLPGWYATGMILVRTYVHALTAKLWIGHGWSIASPIRSNVTDSSRERGFRSELTRGGAFLTIPASFLRQGPPHEYRASQVR